MPKGITVEREGAGLRIRGALQRPRDLLRKIGAALQADAEEAFSLQRLGEHDWPVRYHFQRNPFINVAGAVSDWRRGASLKGRRFVRKPALFDTGNLANSISSPRAVNVGLMDVTVGTTVEYAGGHQEGGESTQVVDDAVRRGAAKFLKTEKGEKFRERLGFLLNPQTTELRTRLHKRPFLGVTDEGEREIIRLIEEHVAEEAS